MKILDSAILAALAALAIFAALNWDALTARTALSFVLFTVEAPLGLILMGFALGFAVVLLGYAAAQRTTLLIEARRHAQELKAQRDIAERAEASRIEELRLQLERETAALRTAIEQAANGLAASIGQVEDKLDRSLQRPGGMPIASGLANEELRR